MAKQELKPKTKGQILNDIVYCALNAKASGSISSAGDEHYFIRHLYNHLDSYQEAGYDLEDDGREIITRPPDARIAELEAENERLTNNLALGKASTGVFIAGLQAENDSLNELLETRTVPVGTPQIVCLCGSTRFMDAFFAAGWKFTLDGWIVLSVGVCKHAEDHGGEALGQEVADGLDELHLRKIDLADRVHVLNVDGYIGESTSKEIAYAKSKDKGITYLELLPPAKGAKE